MRPDDSSLLQLILKRLDDMERRFDGVATREDLSRLVSLDLYKEARASDTRSSEDLVRRLANLEQDVRGLREDATRRAIAEAGTGGRVNQIGISARAAQDGISRLKDLLLGGLGTAVVYLLINALQRH